MRTSSAPLVLLDRCIHHHQAAGGMQLGRRIGDPPLDGSPVGQPLAERHLLVGVLDQHVERIAAPCRCTTSPSAGGAR